MIKLLPYLSGDAFPQYGICALIHTSELYLHYKFIKYFHQYGIYEEYKGFLNFCYSFLKINFILSS
ncbi:hypothetical protein B5F35_04255 [Anaeromassilibacillus sp. An200]|nr:hypothetical protein B5F35_04255 [Anaeromassilibacillus sp. An200]